MAKKKWQPSFFTLSLIPGSIGGSFLRCDKEKEIKRGFFLVYFYGIPSLAEQLDSTGVDVLPEASQICGCEGRFRSR